MAVLHSLLAVYGALDEVAEQTQDPEMRAMVEQLLPGTTGPGQRGWYAEIQEFVRQNASDPQAAEFPSPQVALEELTGRTPGLEDTPGNLASREVARLFYASAALRKLQDFQIGRSNPVPVLQDLDTTLLDEVLGLAGDPPQERGGGTVSGPRVDRITELQELLLERFTGLQEWTPFIAEAANPDNPLVAHDVAAIPAITVIGENSGPVVTLEREENGVVYTEENHGKVTGEVIEFKGILSALLTTEFMRSNFDIEKVKRVVDPLNWDNCNKFFCEMERVGPDSLGSSQVFEYVSTHKDFYQIKTALKYRKEDRGNSVVINYDFSNNRAGDSGQVRVDNGYIILTPTNDGKGTRVITSKMVAIDGLSPTAVAIYAGAMGWLAIGEMMMFDCAGGRGALQDPSDPIVPWNKSPEKPRPGDRTTQTTPTTPGSGSQQPPAVSRLLMAEGTSRLAGCIEGASKETAVVADKWVKGELSVKDMVAYTDNFGRLASEPWRILDEMIKQAANPPSADPPKGGGST